MSEEPLEPLDPALAKLFATTSIPEPPVGASARVFRRVGHAIGAGAIDPSPATSAAKVFGARSIALAAATFVLGGAVGAAVMARLRPSPAPQVVYIDRPVSAARSSIAIELPEASAPPPVTTIRRAASAVALSPSPSTVGDTLGIERGMIDDARSKLASDDAEGALRRLDEHAQRFPKARLVEEREALAIQALANMGKGAEARARAKAFHEHHPTSVYGAAVDAAIGSLP
jgi:hypothetical protein